ncbi:hypothetical protein K469DRAFT_83538 [Zopfia rhizophila CBS 207.26]|uniref:F-box domain-containing protein n=1 Tax=Zopfia rhizophila CBS 207.26 TaxID=1314779 RepID=A0A6A6EDE4_9PEZI|nr:hypothetical protein K469DRAFT_83538 [Zopfia rhizophila CBS 207.26]
MSLEGGIGVVVPDPASTSSVSHVIKNRDTDVPSSASRSKRARNDSDDNVELPLKRFRREGMFRFLDLPGELQNQIYEYAVEETGKDLLYKTTKDSLRPKPPIPFLGLTQTCSKIRSEFRGWWMSVHTIPLYHAERYISSFLLPPAKKDKKRAESPKGKLAIQVKDQGMKMDMVRILRLKARIPDYEITFVRGDEEVSAEYLFGDWGWACPGKIRGLNQLIGNTNPKWLRWIRGSLVTQVRIDGQDLHIVVKERAAEKWMKQMVLPTIPDDFVATIGLDGLEYFKVGFGVCY